MPHPTRPHAASSSHGHSSSAHANAQLAAKQQQDSKSAYFSTNVTPRLGAAEVHGEVHGAAAATGSSSIRPAVFGGSDRATDFKETQLVIPEDGEHFSPNSSGLKSARTSLADDAARLKSQMPASSLSPAAHTAPDPALPDELLEFLARDPHAQKATGGSVVSNGQAKSLPSQLPSLQPSSPFSIKQDAIARATPSSSSTVGSPSSSLKKTTPSPFATSEQSLGKQSSKSSLRRRALLDAGGTSSTGISGSTGSAEQLQPGTPNVVPPTPSPRSPSLAPSPSGSRGGLRKAASAESLRQRSIRTMQGPNMPAPSVSTTPHPSGPSNAPLQQRADLKTFWKSFSSKLDIRPSGLKDRESGGPGGTLAAPAVPAASLGRKSLESAVRHSLSIYPRRSSDNRRLSSSSTASRASTSSRPTLSTKNGLGLPGFKGDCTNSPAVASPVEDVSSASQLFGKSAGAGSQTSLNSVLEIEEDQAWLQRERFTHDLSQRRKRATKPSRVSTGGGTLGRTTPKPALLEGEDESELLEKLNGGGPASTAVSERAAPSDGEDVDDQDEEEDEEEDDADSDIASQLSYVDSADIPVNTSTPSLSTRSGSTTSIGRHGTLRRTAGPSSLGQVQSDGMEAGLRRNRADSGVKVPSNIVTGAEIPHLLKPGSVVDEAPVASSPSSPSTVYTDAVSSPLAKSPATDTTSPPRGSRGPLSPVTPTCDGKKSPSGSRSPLSPAVSIQTVRPRSMSESWAVAPLLAEPASPRNGRIYNAAPSPGKSNMSAGNGRNGRDGSTVSQPVKDGADAPEYRRARAGSGAKLLQELTSESLTLADYIALYDSITDTDCLPAYDDYVDDAAHQAPRKSSADLVIAMVGPKRVGKSTILVHNLKLSKDKSAVLYEDSEGNKVSSYSGNFLVYGKPCTIEVLEVDTDILSSGDEGLCWPEYLPRPDGAMICFRYGDPKALEQLTTLLHGFWTRGGIHLIVLATQCPASRPDAVPHKAEGDKAAEICNIHGAGVVHLDGGIEDPHRKARNSLQWILREILDARGANARKSPSRAKKTLHAKKSNTTLLSDAKSTTISSGAATPASPGRESPRRTKHAQPDNPPVGIKAFSPKKPESALASVLGTQQKHSQLDIYLSKEDIIDKFLRAAVVGDDKAHIAAFLTMYRRFAKPYDVLSSLVARFGMLRRYSETDLHLSQWAQIQLCSVLAHWLHYHSGDFANPATFRLLHSFLTTMWSCTWLHQVAIEVEHAVVSISTSLKDQDTAWALPDVQTPPALPQDSASPTAVDSLSIDRRPSLVPSLASTMSNTSETLSSQLSVEPTTPATPTYSSDFHLSPTSAQSTSAQSQAHASDIKAAIAAQRRRSYSDSNTNASSEVASSNRSIPSSVSGQKFKQQAYLVEISNLVLDCKVQPLARTITKHAWDIFAHTQPRDMLRYVMAPRDPTNPDATPHRNADNPVSKGVAFSNYLSNWTATMLLVQSKQKSRGQMLEHLITLAFTLRTLDNFECLMAVLVGLNSAPVHRLVDLVELVPEDLYKKFRSMNRLMAASRSFSAYRLAITNARPEMIPYLGIHLQDMTRLHDGKSDMRNGLVNWTKMRQVAKHASIVDSARLAPRFSHDEGLSRLVIDLPVHSLNDDDETLYDLSYAYKPRQKRSGSNSQTTKLKRLLREAISPPSRNS